MSDQQRLRTMISFHFYTGSRLMQRMYRPYFDEWNITYPQYLVLLCLWEKDGQTIADLSTPLDLDSGTLSPLLKRMEASGYVRRQADHKDYRRVLFFLTQRGRKLKAQASEMETEVTAMLGLDVDDLKAISEIMAKINPVIE
ncbi:MarR family winged helix-turn-helix transcriptional regulator [Corynebacterium mustelae]|nr:MarR family transcriptional regulator [Corynebacterium mustelae]